MQRLLTFVMLVLALVLAATSDAPLIQAAGTRLASSPNGTRAGEHPAGDGHLSAEPHMLPDMDAAPEAAQATVVDPRNPAWVTHYGTNAGVRFFAPRQASAAPAPQGPSIDVGAWQTLFPGGTFTVNGMADAPDGRVFVAVAGSGLLVYAPQAGGRYAWGSMNTSNSSLASNNVTAVEVFQNQLWVGTSDAGLSVEDLGSQTWTTFNTGNSSILSDDVTRITPTSRAFGENQVWLSTPSGASVYHFSGFKTITPYWTSAPIGGPVFDIAIQYVTVSGRFISFEQIAWIGNGSNTMRWDVDANSTTTYTSFNTALCKMDRSTRIVVDLNNAVWFADQQFQAQSPQKAPAGGFVDNGLCMYDGSNWTLYNYSSPGLPENTISDLSVDYAGRVWISFPGGPGYGGGAVYDQGTWWITVSTDNILHSYNVTSVHAVGEDVWWGFGSSDGLSVHSPNWRPLLASDMLGTNGQRPTALLIEKKNLWVGLGTGLSWWDGSAWHNSGALPGNASAITALARGPGGLLWIGTSGNGLYSWGTNFTQYTTADGLPSNTIRDILFDQSGKMWVATDAGLALRGSGYWLVLNQSTSQINSNDLRALAEDRRGRIWIATGANGIDIYDPNAHGTNPWSMQTTSNGLPSNAVNGLVADPSGAIWAATGAGVGQFDRANHTWTVYNTGNSGLPGNQALSIASDPTGRIWAGTTTGVAVVDADSWNAYHVSGSMLGSDRVVALASDGTLTWLAGADTLAVRGLITGPIGNFPPAISDFTPAQGPPGTTLTINGNNFDSRGPSYNQVAFTGQYQGIYDVPAQVLAASQTQLTVQVPELAYTGQFQVTANHLNGQSATPFTITPAISSVSPACVGLGNELDIVGDGFIAGSSYPYAYVKIGNGPWRVADAVDPTEIRQMIRPGDTAGPVSVALGSTSGPTMTSSQSISILTPAVANFAVQQGVQGEQMIWGKRTIVMVTLQSTGGNCTTTVDGGLATIDGGTLEWLKSDGTTLTDGAALLPSSSSLTLSDQPPAPPALANAVSFVMFNSYGMSYYPPMSTFNGVRLHITNGPVEVLTYDIPKSNFNFVDTQSSLKMLMIHVYPTFTDTVQTNAQFLSDEYAGFVQAARAFPEQDAEAYSGQDQWLVPAVPVIGRDSPVNLSDTGFLGGFGQFGDLRDDGGNILDSINDSGGDLAQATTLIDTNLYASGSPNGKAMMSCFYTVGYSNQCDVTAAFNRGSGSPQTAGTILQEAVHVTGWVDSGSPNINPNNGAHSIYDENQTTSGCALNRTFRQALVDQTGSAGRVIRLTEDQAPYQFGMFGCDPTQQPKSIMSYAPNQFNNNVFLEPLDFNHELDYILATAGRQLTTGLAASAAYTQTWRLAGNFDASDHVTVTMAYLLGTTGALTPPATQASYSLRLLAANQSVLLDFPFSPAGYNSTPAQARALLQQTLGFPFSLGAFPANGFPDPQPHFSLRVPFPTGTASVELLHNGHLIWSKAVSASTPGVSLTAPTGGTFNEASAIPVTWSASDPDGIPLMFLLDYSGDNGVTWNPISSVLKGTSFTWKPGFVPATSQARLRVRASDGFHVASAMSNPFTLTAQPPLAIIKSPSNGASIAEGQTVQLVGGSITPDGLDAGTFQWLHNGNVVGNSRVISRTLNQIGTSVFDLLVTSNGLTATQSVSLTVLPNFIHDGIPDAWKLQYKLNPLDPSVPFQDPDGDGLTNLQEYQFGTNPINPDTDGDGASDGAEVAAGTDPRIPDQKPPTGPVLHVGATTLGWTVLLGAAAPAPTSIWITNGGPGTVTWSLSSRPAWLQVSPITGTAPTNVTFSAAPQGLGVGSYTAFLTASAAGAAGSPWQLAVTLNIVGFRLDLPLIRR